MTTRRYRRIAIYGHSGSGKSWLARIIGARLGLPVVELDALYHVNEWDDTPEDEFRANIERALESSPQGWISAGNYLRVKDLVMDRADMVVWLRLPFRIVYIRLLRRTIRGLFSRKPLWEGAELRESWRQTFITRDSILLWGFTNWKPHIRKMTEALATAPETVEIVVLRSSREVNRFIAELPRSEENSSGA